MNNFWSLSLLIVSVVCIIFGISVIHHGNEKVDARAQLTDAYSTFDRCGSKGKYSCEVFKGRYWLPDHQLVVDREINGFVYKDFKNAGDKAPMGIEKFSRTTLEGDTPFSWFLLTAVGFFGVFMFVIVGFLT